MLVNLNGFNCHYEWAVCEGARDTLLILNGIMMSTDSWKATVDTLSKRMNVLTVDFRDQGRSDKMTEGYDIDIHADDLKALLSHLHLDQVHVMGISYGGEVAMILALKYPECIDKLILCNTTPRVTKHLRAIGNAWEEAAKLYDGESFFKLAMPLIYSPTFYETHYKWLEEREKIMGKSLDRQWFDAYIRLSQSTQTYDIMNDISSINHPTLCIGADEDLVTPLSEQKLIVDSLPNAELVVLTQTGHAACYEKQTLFDQIILGFI